MTIVLLLGKFLPQVGQALEPGIRCYPNRQRAALSVRREET
jgi:hypothetical protein